MPEVLTPFGTRSSDDVIAIPKGGQIVHNEEGIILLDGAGKSVHRAQHSNEPIRLPPPPPQPDPKKWTARATWTNTSERPIERPIESFTTNWRVPPYPSADCGQTLFIYSVAQPTKCTSALLPVLQYGPSAAGGGNYWAVATWYIISNCVYHTCLTRVEIGDPLHAAIRLTHINYPPLPIFPHFPSSYDYTARFKGIEETVLNVRYSEELKFIALILQAYIPPHIPFIPVDARKYYPPGLTVFYPTDVSLVPKLEWEISEQDRVKVTVDVNTAMNGEITFKYPYDISQ